MKKVYKLSLLVLGLWILSIQTSQAQSPQKFNYQGIARTAEGNPLANQNLSIKLEVLPTIDATEAEYVEVQSVTTNQFGLYTIQIGNGTSTKGTMQGVKWETGNKYIHVSIDPKGGQDFQDAGTTQLLSVPYALYADKAGISAETISGNNGGNTRATNNFIEKTSSTGVVNSTSQIYDNGSGVAIGFTNPIYTFESRKNGNTDWCIRTTNTAGTSRAAFRIQNEDSTLGQIDFTKFGKSYGGTFMGISRNNMAGINSLTGPFVLNCGGDMIFGNSLTVSPFTQTPRMTINGTTGNVGFGLPLGGAAAARVEVNGQIKINGGAPGLGKVLTSDANGLATWELPSSSQWLNSSSNIYNGNAGNVGIGTSTPSAKLDVNTTSNYVAQFNGASPMYMGLFEGNVYRGYLGSYSGNTEDVDFGTGSGNTTGKLHLTIQAVPKLTVDNNGNIGIGTTTPSKKVHINGGDLFVQSSSGLIRFGYDGANEWQMATTSAGADLRWYTTTNGGTTITPRHYFSQNGNVGIGGFSGAGTPLARMHIIAQGTTSSTNSFMIQNSSLDTLIRIRDDGRMGFSYNGTTYGRTLNLGGTGINFYTANEAGFGGAIFPTDTSLVIWSNSGANNYLVLQPSWGNTGFGTYTPNAKLHINGNQLIGNNSTNPATGYALSVRGNVIAEGFTTLAYGSWPDYVFEKDYPLMPITDLEKSIKENKHLPNIPPASEMEKNGIQLGEMTKNLVEKVEELTLYMIELNKKNEALQTKVNELEKELQSKK